MLAGSIAMAAEENDWPEPVYFNPSQLKTITDPPPKPAQKSEKKGGGLFGLFRKKETVNPNEIPRSYNVNHPKPQEPLPSPDPLIRLPYPVKSDAGVVSAGIYLAHHQLLNNDTRVLMLTRQNRAFLTVLMHPSTQPDENMQSQGTPSPLTPSNPKAPPAVRADVSLSPDQKSATFSLWIGSYRFDSDPYPVILDSRPILTF